MQNLTTTAETIKYIRQESKKIGLTFVMKASIYQNQKTSFVFKNR